jgi:hypothetical protein
MSKKKRPRAKGKQAGNSGSLILPIAVGILVVVIIVGAIVALEKRQAVMAAAPTGTLSVPVVTAQPQPTTLIPYPEVLRISLKDTQKKLDKGDAVLVDTRTKEAYDQSHAVGAISLPEAEVDARLGELSREKLLILYCT